MLAGSKEKLGKKLIADASVVMRMLWRCASSCIFYKITFRQLYRDVSKCQLQVIMTIQGSKALGGGEHPSPSGKSRRLSRCKRNTPHGSICYNGLCGTQQSMPSYFIKMLDVEFILTVDDIEYQHRLLSRPKAEALLNTPRAFNSSRYIVIYK